MARTLSAQDLIDIAEDRYNVAYEQNLLNASTISEAGNDLYWYGQRELQSVKLLWQITGKSIYLDKMLALMEGKMNNAKRSEILIDVYSRTADNSVYFDDTYLSWIAHPQWSGSISSFPGGNYSITSHHQGDAADNGKEDNLDHNIAMRYFTGALVTLKHSPTVMSNPTIKTKYDNLLDFAIEQWNKWYQRSLDGHNAFTKSLTHMLSHLAKMGLDLYYITGETKYYDIYNNWLYDLSKNPKGNPNGNTTFDSGDGFLSTNLRNYGDGGYIWNSQPGSTSGGTDWAHAANEFDLIYHSWLYGENDFNMSDMVGFSISFENRYWLNTPGTKGYYYLEPTTNSSLERTHIVQVMVGWMLSGEFNDNVLEEFELNNIQYTENYSTVASYATAAYAATRRDGGTIYYPEVEFTPENVLPRPAGNSINAAQALIIHC